MARTQSESTSEVKKKRRKQKKSDGFQLYMPLVDHDGQELPVLNTYGNLVVFTDKPRFEQWRDHYNLKIARIRVYRNVSSIPRLVKAMCAGKRPKGLSVNSNPFSANQYMMGFTSKVNDSAFTDDIESISSFIKTLILDIKDMPMEIA